MAPGTAAFSAQLSAVSYKFSALIFQAQIFHVYYGGNKIKIARRLYFKKADG